MYLINNMQESHKFISALIMVFLTYTGEILCAKTNVCFYVNDRNCIISNDTSYDKDYEVIKSIVIDKLNIEANKVKPDANIKDLGADNLDIVELIMEMERRFNLPVDDEVLEKCKTVNDLVIVIQDARKKSKNTKTTEHKNEFDINSFLQKPKVTGTSAYVFTLSDSSGRLHSLALRPKKVILLNFWASWCTRCIAEFPVLKALNTKYSSQGLEIICISLGDDNHSWLQALDKLTPPGLQLIATEKDQVVINNYEVRSVPHVFLIDQDGKIIADYLDREKLREKLAELLGN